MLSLLGIPVAQLFGVSGQHQIAQTESTAVIKNIRARLIKMGQLALVTAIVTACAAPVTRQDENQLEASELGAVAFDVSCSTEVSEDFDQEIALLHHMQYVQSRTAFEQIVQSAPDCGMAHWGVAMTLFQPLWPSRPGPEILQRGWEEVQLAQSLGLGSDRETDLVNATAAFFQEPESADWRLRIQRWSDGMNQAYAARPDDIETAVFYALSQLAVGQYESDRMEYHAHAADVLLKVYEQEPAHPGAIHYTIHANDVHSRANESLDVVRSYGAIAPAVPHALHMPTHIFVRLGSWPEVIEWNRRSADAALNFPAPDGISHHYPHALDYLVYAYLQQGNDRMANSIVEETLAREEPFQGTFISAFHLASIPARYAVERHAWDEAKAIIPATPSSVAWERFYWAEAISWFAQGLGAVHTDDMEQAEQAELKIIELRDKAKAAGEDGFANYIEIDRLVLSAWRAYGAGEIERSLELAGAAIDLEASTEKHPITPGAIYPAQEALGDLLLNMGRFKEAYPAYEKSLVTWPGRFNSIAGAARAAREAGLEDKATTHYQSLMAMSVEPDSSRPALLEARKFLKR
ncbi:MAG: hypothetical protein QNJ46_06600 [Leptolyngbyaceae cyanobacterium MO_188.B28]|nr:hypothetical protein [Leptolyngbyaceae cyanobacterium MO_188.B28]